MSRFDSFLMWAPCQSHKVKEIAKHMTPSEKRKALKFSFLGGMILSFMFVLPPLTLVLAGPGAFAIATGFFPLLGVVAIVQLSKRQKKYLCSTGWGKQQGYSPSDL